MTKGRMLVTAGISIFGLFVIFAVASWIGMKHLGSDLAANLKPLELTIKKEAIDRFLLIKQPHSSVIPPNEYSVRSLHDPAALAADEKLFGTWQTAVQLGQQTLKSTTGDWVRSSADIGFAPPEQRVDAWGHSFCLLRRADTIVVVSAGPRAPSSPVCRNIRVQAEELVPLPRARLLESPSGYLILVLDQKPHEAQR